MFVKLPIQFSVLLLVVWLLHFDNPAAGQVDPERELSSSYARQLLKAFASPDVDLRRIELLEFDGRRGLTPEAVAVLSGLGPQIAELLRDENPAVRRAAINALRAFPSQLDIEVTQRVSELIHHSESELRVAALRLLGRGSESGKLGLTVEFADDLFDLINEQETADLDLIAAVLGKMREHMNALKPRMVELLSAPNPGVRHCAIEVLVAWDQITDEVRIQIAEMLNDQDAAIRQMVIEVLGTAGAGAIDFTPRMVELLDDDVDSVRFAAIRALVKMEQPATRVAPEICDALVLELKTRNNLPRIYGEDAKLISPYLITLMGHQDQQVRLLAANAVQKLAETGNVPAECAPILVGLLEAPDWIVHGAASLAMKSLGGQAKAVLPQLAILFQHGEKPTRLHAIEIVGGMGESATACLPQLAALLSHSDVSTRSAAMRAMGRLGITAAPVLQDVVNQLATSREPTMRLAAAELLGAMGEAAKPCVPQIGRLLSHRDSGVRFSALKAVAALGETAQDLAPQVVPMLSDPWSHVRSSAGEALQAMGATAADVGPQIAVHLKDRDPAIRRQATLIFVKICASQEAFAPDVVKLLRDQDVSVRSYALISLGEMGPVARRFAPQIVEQLEDSNDPGVQILALSLIGNLGEDAEPYLPQLVDLFNRPNDQVRLAALHAVAAASAQADTFAPQIAELLNDPNPSIRISAVNTLAAMKSHDKMFIKQIGKLLKDGNPNVRGVAKEAFGTMGVAMPTASGQTPDGTTPDPFPNGFQGPNPQVIAFLEHEGWKIETLMGGAILIRVADRPNTVDNQKLKLLCKVMRNVPAPYLLFLGNTKISDEGLKHLPLKFCGVLDLSGTLVTDAGLWHLRGLTNLYDLQLQGTRVTNEGLEKLHAALPNCRVTH